MLKKNGKIWTFNDKWIDLRRLRNVYLNVEGSGTLSANPMSGYKGDEVTLYPTASSGHSFDYYDSYGAIIENNKFRFGNQDAYITAHFKANVYNVTVNVSGNGTASANPNSGTMGTEITLSNTPQAHNYFDHYTVNGQTITGSTFTLGAEDAVVTAYFQQTAYNISVTNPTGGTITPSSSTAHYGDTITLSVTTSADYQLDHYVVNGNTIQGNSFTVTGDMTVTAVLKAAVRTYQSKFYEISSTTTYWGQYDLFAANNTNGNQFVNMYVWDGSAWQSWSSYRFQYLDCNNVSASPLVLTNNGSSHNTATLTAKNNNNQRNTFYIKFEWAADHDIGLTFNNFHVASGSYTTGLVVKRAEGNNYDWNGGIYQSDSNYHDLMQWTDILSTGGGLVPYKKV
jgi:hypothetical protein